jgi:hypothetical protein
MDNNNCFEKLNIKLSPDNPLFDDCKNFEYIQKVNPVGKKNTFPQHNLTNYRKYFYNEPILKLIEKYNLEPKIFQVAPGWFYNWHRDGFRQAAFNLSLSRNSDSIVLFAHEYPNYNKPYITMESYSYFPTTRIQYEQDTLYLVNIQIPHCSINVGTEPRYLLTMGNFTKVLVDSFENNEPDIEYYKSLIETLTIDGFINR